MSQNEKNNELNTMKITDDTRVLSDEMIEAYEAANVLETPDLWSRIDSGFEMEMQRLSEENEKNTRANALQQTDDAMHADESTDNVIDFSKRATRRKTFAAIAAVIVLCILVVPFVKMGNKHEKKEKSYESAEQCYDADTQLQNGMNDEAISNDMCEAVNDTEHAVSDKQETGVMQDEVIEAVGYFVYDADELYFEIESMVSHPVGTIDSKTRILLQKSDKTAASYYTKEEATTIYGPFSVFIIVDNTTINEQQPTGVLLEKK